MFLSKITPNLSIKDIDINEIGFNQIDLFSQLEDSCERIKIKQIVVDFDWDLNIIKLVKNLRNSIQGYWAKYIISSLSTFL